MVVCGLGHDCFLLQLMSCKYYRIVMRINGLYVLFELDYFAASQLQGPQSCVWLCEMFSHGLLASMVFLLVLRFPPSSQNMWKYGLATVNCPRGVNLCAWCSTIQGVFLPHIQFSQESTISLLANIGCFMLYCDLDTLFVICPISSQCRLC